MNREQHGSLVMFGFGTLVLFYLIWACLHDIAHGDEGTVEWTVLGLCALALAALYWRSRSGLSGRARTVWLAGTRVLIVLYSASAVGTLLYPEYAKDQMLALTFLAAAVPALCVIGTHLVRSDRSSWGRQ